MFTKNTLILWGVVIYCCAASTVVWAETAEQANRQIQAVYDRQDAGMNRRDLKEAIFHLDPAYLAKGVDGSSEIYKACVADLSAFFAHKQTASFITLVQKVRMVGPKTAMVEAVHSMDFGLFNSKTGVSAAATSSYTVHDKWIKRPQGWMLLQTFTVGKKHERSRRR